MKDRLEVSRQTSNSDIIFKDGRIPYSKRFEDIYFSSTNGLEEVQHVFLSGNGLPEAWQNKKKFTIVEFGFGTGLNFLVTWKFFDKTNKRAGKLHYYSIERYPLELQDMKFSISTWPELDIYFQELARKYPVLRKGFNRISLGGGRVTLNILVGEVNEMLNDLNLTADAWFLDGFSPSKNPSMWSQQLFDQMTGLSKAGTTLATFSAASMVSTGLAKAGFSIVKRPGYGTKREMITGIIN